ncbi:MAG: c-type cytochrome biogenesis protein CcmI [Burkholderiales bacterium]|nr:c-type cytochrome biogenesis protein CcmI [Burkholderiales bacterium]
MESKTSAPLDKLKSQLAQIDALIAEGTLKGDAARRRRAELESRILALVTGEPEAAAPSARPSRGLVLAVTAFVVAVGAIGYAWRGNRDGLHVGPGESVEAADGGGGANAPHATDTAQIEAMVTKLAERLKSKPDDAEGWSMLARSYTALGKYPEALVAYKKVTALKPNDAQALADLADGMATANNRNLDGEPTKLVEQSLKIDPDNVKALALAGTVAFNHEQYKAAVAAWEHAARGADPQGDFTKQLQGAIDEARKRAGMPPSPTAAAAPPTAGEAAGTAQAQPAAAAANPAQAVAGRVTIKPAVKSQVSGDDTVFIYARAPSGSRMPLAILRKKVSDLPLDFTLDDSLAMSPAMAISTQSQVVVGARISKSGNAMPQPGDYEVLSAPVKLGATGVVLELGDVVR